MVKCGYCGTISRTRRLTTIAAQTPADWRPPPVWTPPPNLPEPATPRTYGNTRAVTSKLLFILIFVGVDILVIPIIIFAAIASEGSQPSFEGFPGAGGASTPDPGSSWDGTSTLVCSGGEHVTVENRTISLPGQTAITAGGNCVLRLVNCTITASHVVMATGNAEVFVEGGTYTSDGVATFSGSTQAELQIRGAHTVGVVGVRVEQQASIRVIGGRLQGTRVCVSAHDQSEVIVEGTEVMGVPEAFGQATVTGLSGPK